MKLNEEQLERRVAERISELTQANEELRRENAERRQAEETLKQSGELFRMLIENSSDIITITDTSGTVKYESPSITKILGYQPDELIGTNGFDLVHPDDLPQIVERFNRNLQLGGELSLKMKCRVRHKDGSWRDLEGIGKAFLDGSGERACVFNTRDVTEQKRAEEKLRKHQEVLQKIFDHIPVMICFFDEDGCLKLMNREMERVIGWSLEEALSQNVDILAASYPDPQELQRARNAIAAGTGEWADFKERTRDGRIIHTTWRDIRLSDGTSVSFGIDITERKRTEEQLRATSEQLRALSASLSSAREEEGIRIARELHDELGSALTSLRWELESFDKIITESVIESQRQALHERIEGMMKLTDTTISAVRRLASELRPGVLDDLGLVEAIEWQANQFQARTGIICRCDCPIEEVDLSQAQSTALFRILQEALTNTLRHAQATRVDIKLDEEDGELILVIKDNGRGITEDEKSGQSSLGLLGMRERVNLIKGKIDITGSEGKETVITVRVPIND